MSTYYEFKYIKMCVCVWSKYFRINKINFLAGSWCTGAHYVYVNCLFQEVFERKMGPGNWKPVPSPVLAMHVLPTGPTVGAIFKDALRELYVVVIWDHLDGISDWNQLRPLNKYKILAVGWGYQLILHSPKFHCLWNLTSTNMEWSAPFSHLSCPPHTGANLQDNNVITND